MSLKFPVAAFVAGSALSVTVLWMSGIDANLGPRSVALSCTVLLTLLFLQKHLRSLAVQVDAVSASFVLFLLWSFAAGMFSVNVSEYLFQLSKDLLFFFVFMIVAFFIRRPDSGYLRLFTQMLICVTFISLAIGFFQLIRVPLFDRDSSYSVVSLHAHKNLFGSFLFLSCALILYGMHRLSGIWRKAAAVLIFSAVLMMILLVSKAIWVALLLSGAVFIASRLIPGSFNLPKRTFFTGVAVILVLLNVFFLFFLPRVVCQDVSGKKAVVPLIRAVDEERLQLWAKTYHMIGKSPISGVGGGNWQIHFPDATLSGIWRAEDLNVSFQRPHNDLLWILSEHGIIGFNLYLCFILLIFFGLGTVVNRDQGSAKSRLYVIFSAIAGYLVIAFCDFPRERIEHNALAACLFAIGYGEATRHALFPSLFRLNSARILLTAAIGVSVLICMLTLARLRSEHLTRRMYDARMGGDSHGVIRRGERANNLFYSVDPTTIPLLWYTANAYMDLGQTEKSLKAFRKAHEVHPFNRNVLNDLASALVMTGDTSAARKYYREAARISPRFDEPKLNLAALYISEKKYDLADSCLRTILHDSERRSLYERLVNASP